MSALSQPTWMPKVVFTHEERYQTALIWIDRKIWEGKIPNWAAIAKSCIIAYSTIQRATNGKKDRKFIPQQL